MLGVGTVGGVAGVRDGRMLRGLGFGLGGGTGGGGGEGALLVIWLAHGSAAGGSVRHVRSEFLFERDEATRECCGSVQK